MVVEHNGNISFGIEQKSKLLNMTGKKLTFSKEIRLCGFSEELFLKVDKNKKKQAQLTHGGRAV